jgi:hypothetical protein
MDETNHRRERRMTSFARQRPQYGDYCIVPKNDLCSMRRASTPSHRRWRSVEAVDAVERRTGRSIVTSNQATIWLTLASSHLAAHAWVW